MEYLFVVIIVVLIAIIYVAGGITRKFISERQKALKTASLVEPSVLSEDEIKELPEAVQKYIAYTGALGKPKVFNFQSQSEIVISLGKNLGFGKMKATEFNAFTPELAREVLMKFRVKGLPVYGLDYYLDHQGGMLQKPLGLFSVVNAHGHKMDDSSALVMLLLNMFTAPSTLVDRRLKWEEVAPLQVKVMLTDEKTSISGLLKFNEEGRLDSFSTEDKYYSPEGGIYQKVGWTTTLGNYQDVGGLRLPTYGEAIWHFSKGDFCYGKLSLKDIKYNLK